jgi:hypothetical protein
MQKILLIWSLVIIVGCGPSEPSNKGIADGMMSSFATETGIGDYRAWQVKVKAKARKIGKGRWAVTMMMERSGESRTLNATAVMDKNGDIHYYTD